MIKFGKLERELEEEITILSDTYEAHLFENGKPLPTQIRDILSVSIKSKNLIMDFSFNVGAEELLKLENNESHDINDYLLGGYDSNFNNIEASGKITKYANHNLLVNLKVHTDDVNYIDYYALIEFSIDLNEYIKIS